MITMAEGRATDSLDYILECPICSEEFSLEGEHVPRILPCSHSLCEMCMEGILLRNPEGCDLLRCPECKMEHPTPNGAKSFTQNKFVLPVIKRKQQSLDLCGKHGREINIFCNDDNCQKSICILCMFEDHRDHNFVDLLQLKEIRRKFTSASNEALKKNREIFKQFLQSNKQKLLGKCEELNLNAETCEEEISLKKEEKIAEVTQIISNIFCQMSQAVKDRTTREVANIQKDVATIDRYLKELDGFEEHDDLVKSVGERMKFRNITTKLKQQAGYRKYSKIKLNDPRPVPVDKVQDLCGNLEEDIVGLNFLDNVDSHLVASALQLHSDMQFRFHVHDYQGEDILGIAEICGNADIVVWNKRLVAKYDVQTGELDKTISERSVFVKYWSGVCVVDLGQTCCAVLSQRNRQTLHFCNIGNIERVQQKHPVAPNPPSTDDPSVGCLATASATVLLYIDESKKPNEVGWLDCSTSPPKRAEFRQPIKLQHDSVQDMCYVNMKHKALLVYACKNGIFAQNSVSSQNEWFITKTSLGPLKNPSSVSTNGRGHVFVSDTNNSVVFIFSSDGVELGTVVDLNGIGKLGPLCWCESVKSLIVSYEVDRMWSILVVKLGDIAK